MRPIVPDASVVVDILIRNEFSTDFRAALRKTGSGLAVPHLLDIEVTSALRKLAGLGRIESHRVTGYLEDLKDFPADRYGHADLLDRVWELRHNFTTYDASYIALAEALEATLVTTDSKMLKGHRAKVVYFGDWIT